MARFTLIASLLPVLVVAMAAARAAQASEHVVVLTDDTFDDKVKEKDTIWFIKFFAPWCGHCKKLAPTWDELGQALESQTGVEVAHVDCTTSKATCSSHEIRSYPTLKLFYNGEEVKKYSGSRDVEALKKFVLDSAIELSKQEAPSDGSVQDS